MMRESEMLLELRGCIVRFHMCYYATVRWRCIDGSLFTIRYAAQSVSH